MAITPWQFYSTTLQSEMGPLKERMPILWETLSQYDQAIYGYGDHEPLDHHFKSIETLKVYDDKMKFFPDYDSKRSPAPNDFIQMAGARLLVKIQTLIFAATQIEIEKNKNQGGYNSQPPYCLQVTEKKYEQRFRSDLKKLRFMTSHRGKTDTARQENYLVISAYRTAYNLRYELQTFRERTVALQNLFADTGDEHPQDGKDSPLLKEFLQQTFAAFRKYQIAGQDRNLPLSTMLRVRQFGKPIRFMLRIKLSHLVRTLKSELNIQDNYEANLLNKEPDLRFASDLAKEIGNIIASYLLDKYDIDPNSSINIYKIPAEMQEQIGVMFKSRLEEYLHSLRNADGDSFESEHISRIVESKFESEDDGFKFKDFISSDAGLHKFVKRRVYLDQVEAARRVHFQGTHIFDLLEKQSESLAVIQSSTDSETEIPFLNVQEIEGLESRLQGFLDDVKKRAFDNQDAMDKPYCRKRLLAGIRKLEDRNELAYQRLVLPFKYRMEKHILEMLATIYVDPSQQILLQNTFKEMRRERKEFNWINLKAKINEKLHFNTEFDVVEVETLLDELHNQEELFILSALKALKNIEELETLEDNPQQDKTGHQKIAALETIINDASLGFIRGINRLADQYTELSAEVERVQVLVNHDGSDHNHRSLLAAKEKKGRFVQRQEILQATTTNVPRDYLTVEASLNQQDEDIRNDYIRLRGNAINTVEQYLNPDNVGWFKCGRLFNKPHSEERIRAARNLIVKIGELDSLDALKDFFASREDGSGFTTEIKNAFTINYQQRNIAARIFRKHIRIVDMLVDLSRQVKATLVLIEGEELNEFIDVDNIEREVRQQLAL